MNQDTKHRVNASLQPVFPATLSDDGGLLARSTLYREFVAEREEILKLKWVESEKVGCDIGLERALVSWVVHHRAEWRKARQSPLCAVQ